MCGPLDLQGERMSIPEKILQAGCDAYAAKFLNGNGSLGDGIEAAYLAIHGHDDWVRAGPPAWTGEGLPPVGAVCEYRRGYVEQPYSYAECTVIAHFVGESGKSLAAFAYVAHDGVVQLGRGMAELFRPIRTPEQIAAEDRDKAIEGMIADTNILTGIMSDRRIMAGQLYDAGYRKQVTE